jgi:hypothetical protein
MKWLLRLWHKRLRAIDIQLLWPSCRDQARDLDRAKAAFAAHAFQDTAWLELGEAEIYRIIDALH